MKKTPKYFAGIETGGTKCFVAIGLADGTIVECTRITTTNPHDTMSEVVCTLKKYKVQYDFETIGIASFGPLNADKSSKDYGKITSTPKIAWQNFNIVNAIKNELNLNIVFDTDVNGAALCEYDFYNKTMDIKNLVYITIGTGIGGGIICDGNLLHGKTNLEVGHIFIPKHSSDIDFKGVCPFHDSCLEGLAAGPALEKRWGVDSAKELSFDHKAWDMEAFYLSYAIANYMLSYNPQKIVLGGGVMHNKFLFDKLRKNVASLINGYFEYSSKDYEEMIVPATFGENTGVKGAIALAMQCHN